MGKSEQGWTLAGIVGAGMMAIVLIATAAGITTLIKKTRPAANEPRQASVLPEHRSDEPYKARIRQLEAELEIERAAKSQRSTKPAQMKNARCVGGTLFAEVNGELRNIGHCG